MVLTDDKSRLRRLCQNKVREFLRPYRSGVAGLAEQSELRDFPHVWKIPPKGNLKRVRSG